MHRLLVFMLLAIVSSHGQKLARINNDYALRMHRTLIAEDTNVLTSPISYLSQLAMLQLVSDGNTVREIRRSIGYESSVTNIEVHRFFSHLLFGLNNQSDNAFKMANVLVLRHDYPATKEAKAPLKRLYNASIQDYNIYNATGTMKAINRLIFSATDGAFPSFLISPLDAYNRLAMLNAVYFSAQWKYQFDTVRRGYFHNRGRLDQLSLIPMMSARGRFAFANLKVHGTDVTSVELPYNGGNLKMLILLPNATGLQGLIRIEQQLTAEDLSKIVDALQEKKVQLTVPSFNLEPGHDVMWSMMFLGVRDAFNHAADFHHLSREEGLFVTKVLHKMIININCDGAQPLPSLSEVQEVLVANKPFLFFIRDTSTGAILFMGRVVSLASK